MEVKELIFPGSCFFCLTKTDFAWCEKCEKDLIQDITRCPVCARRSSEQSVCGACLKRQPCFNSTEVLLNYQFPANFLIKSFKFKNKPELARCFAEKFAEKLKRNVALTLPKTIVPVPLHAKRQRERGYNQSLEFARQLSRHLGLETNTSLCKRTINTDPQSSLPMKTRRKNVKGAFSLCSSIIPEHIAIVDDVITTGSTISELANLFRKAGCQQIDVWAIART